MDSLEQLTQISQSETLNAEIIKANEASAELIRESYNTMVIEHRHIWIECD